MPDVSTYASQNRRWRMRVPVRLVEPVNIGIEVERIRTLPTTVFFCISW